MAKGNMLLGYATGSVGDLTFKRVKGQQVQVPRVRNPHNPRSAKQSIQRARFAAAVKFFTRGNTNFYKYAFENKKQVESDYNAFMRENIKRAPSISREAFDNYDYPIFAPFIMAKGTLQPLSNDIAERKVRINLGVAAPASLPVTIGDLSSVLVATEAYNAGDILTLVTISSPYNGSYPSVDAEGSGKPAWVIRQIILDTTATDTLANALGVAAQSVDGSLVLTDATGTTLLAGTLNAFVAVHSRNTSEGLKASTQELILSEAAATAYDAAFADAYKAEVILSWQRDGQVDAAPDAILQGSIAYGDQDADTTPGD